MVPRSGLDGEVMDRRLVSGKYSLLRWSRSGERRGEMRRPGAGELECRFKSRGWNVGEGGLRVNIFCAITAGEKAGVTNGETGAIAN